MRPTTRRLAAAAVIATLLACIAVPAVAKESLQATLDAPIALGTPPGTEIVVGVTVVVPGDDGVMHPVEGSPIQLILTGRDGDRTRAAGAADREPGHYLMRVAIPAGGVRGLEVVMHGTTDMPLMLTADPFTFGGVTARTAQLAPPLAARMTPFPGAPTAVVAPVAVASEPAPTPAAAPSDPTPVLIAGLAGVALALAGALVVILRRSRAGRIPAGAGGARRA